MTGAAIVVRDLRKRYAKVEAVRGVSFDVDAGTTTALLGGNGAGNIAVCDEPYPSAGRPNLFDELRVPRPVED